MKVMIKDLWQARIIDINPAYQLKDNKIYWNEGNRQHIALPGSWFMISEEDFSPALDFAKAVQYFMLHVHKANYDCHRDFGSDFQEDIITAMEAWEDLVAKAKEYTSSTPQGE